jgi:hypothetical protein
MDDITAFLPFKIPVLLKINKIVITLGLTTRCDDISFGNGAIRLSTERSGKIKFRCVPPIQCNPLLFQVLVYSLKVALTDFGFEFFQ